MARSEELEIDDRDVVHSLARGLDVIRSFTREKPLMTLADVSRATGLTRATVRRFLWTLVREGYAETDGKYFSLKPKVLELGFSALPSMTIGEAAQPILNDLEKKVSESCFIAILDDLDVLYIARAMGRHRVNVNVPVGSRAPAYAVSTGRVLLAALSEEKLEQYLKKVELRKLTPNTVTSKAKLKTLIEETRKQGWCLVDQELDVGLRSLSVPIKNRLGEVVAALNICCPTSRVTFEQMRTQFIPLMMQEARAITAALPMWPVR